MYFWSTFSNTDLPGEAGEKGKGKERERISSYVPRMFQDMNQNIYSSSNWEIKCILDAAFNTNTDVSYSKKVKRNAKGKKLSAAK